jgi:hypothetical protein
MNPHFEVAKELARIARGSTRNMQELVRIAQQTMPSITWEEVSKWFSNDGQPVPQRKIPLWTTGCRSDSSESKWIAPENMKPRYDRMFSGRLGRA